MGRKDQKPKYWHAEPSKALLDMLEGMTDQSILSGPDRVPDDFEISDILAGSWKSALQDFMLDNNISHPDDGTLVGSVNSPLERFSSELFKAGRILMDVPEDEARIIAAESGMLLLQKCADWDRAELIGMFWGSTLIIDPISNIRGNGYGRDLVMARLFEDEALPTWDHDTPGYSTAGAQTIRSARRRLVELNIKNASEPTFESEFQ